MNPSPDRPPLPPGTSSREDVGSALRKVWLMLQPFIVLSIVAIIFTVYGLVLKPESPFLSSFRRTLIAEQTATVAMGALGMTVVIIGGGIDLSVGAILALCSVVLATALRDGMNPIVATGIVLAIGSAAGSINGFLVTGLRLVPFIVTLGTMMVFRGLAEQVAHQDKIPVHDAPAWLGTLLDPPAKGSYQLMPTGAWLVVAAAIALAIVMRLTVFGRHVFAIGSNEATARLCGVNVPFTKIVVYALSGFFMAVAGLFSFSYLSSQGDPEAGLGMELDIIAAVVIGGGSLSGGRGSVLGSIVGALTMTTLQNGCVYAQVSDPVQKIIIGGIIVAAVAVDQLTQSRSKR
jgi:ribose/xylose/arabinose/galactoside ABC-type transport system permease subunit